MSARKVLVTGVGGFLGARVAAFFSEKGYEVAGLAHSDLDISDPGAVLARFKTERPDAVIHCAAISDTGYSQQHPDESYKVNVEGSVNIATACVAVGAKLIYMSSDQVYGGCKIEGPLPESLDLSPNGVYGQHKLLAEQKISAILPSAVGLRLTWMYDRPSSRNVGMKMNRNIFVSMEASAAEGRTMKACTLEHRGLTNVWDVIANIERCLDIPGGVYNFGCGNDLDSYETYSRLAGMLGYPTSMVIPDDSWSRNLAMDCSRLNAVGIHFPTTIDSLKEMA